MADYIDREKYCAKTCRCNKNYCGKTSCAIWTVKSEDVAPVVHAHWIKIGRSDFECSNCHKLENERKAVTGRYCWYCGAKMARNEGGITVFFKKNQPKGMGYPVCDHLNNALRRLLEAPFVDEYAVSEICWAIRKSGGYFKADVKQMLSDSGVWDVKNGEAEA